jgi:acyl-lipid omega-6 desaturase (Delta-12 desaturase)
VTITNMAATVTSRPTLDTVRSFIPESCYRRSWKSGLRIVVQDVLLWVGSLFLLYRAHSPAAILGATVLAGLAVSAMFVTAHDACHGALLPSDRANAAVAFALMVPSLHVRSAWDLGHNRIHHGFTVKQGADFVWHPLTLEQYQLLPWWSRVRHRFEWSSIGSGGYYLREVWWNKMIRFTPPKRYKHSIAVDRLAMFGCALVLWSAAAFAGFRESGSVITGLLTGCKLVVLPFLVFSHVIGWTVHVHHVQRDTVWFTPEAWSKFGAQMEGTTILRIPRVLDVFFHNIFVHVPHHVDMRIPCYHLRLAATAITAAFPGVVVDRRLRMRDYFATTGACKLYDFGTQRWLRYPTEQVQSGRRSVEVNR